MRKTFSFILALLALNASGCIYNIFWQAPDKPAETLYAKTPDGWRLAIYHYPPRKIDPKRAPVILCHGMAANHTFWNIADYCNFTAYLQKAGYDVYTVDLRGHGNSRRDNPFQDFIASPGLARSGKKDPFFWTIDDYIRTDVPTIIEAVRKKTGQQQVFWVGHSMGGMVMYGFLETYEHPEWVKGFVALGSPLSIPQPPSEVLRHEAEQPRFLRHAVLAIGIKRPANALAPVMPLLKTPIDILYYNRGNVRTDTINRMYANCLENIPRGVSDQMMDMVLLRDLQNYEQDFNYFENAKKVTSPVLLRYLIRVSG